MRVHYSVSLSGGVHAASSMMYGENFIFKEGAFNIPPESRPPEDGKAGPYIKGCLCKEPGAGETFTQLQEFHPSLIQCITGSPFGFRFWI